MELLSDAVCPSQKEREDRGGEDESGLGPIFETNG
jgi:hypothetical protein